MISEEDIYYDLMDHPNADVIVSRAQKALEEEQRKRMEFREWLSPSVKAEFINGETIIHSPNKRGHLEVSENAHLILSLFVRKRGLGKVSYEKALVEIGRNDFEPDLCFWETEKTKDWDEDTMIHPVPNQGGVALI
ncbi:MAG: Uma2 family endonuclease [Bacteroidota bacterium]